MLAAVVGAVGAAPSKLVGMEVMIAPESMVPVHTALAGQQAICPTWSMAHEEDLWQQRFGEPKLAHDIPSDEHGFWRGRSSFVLSCCWDGGKNGE